MNLFDMTGKIAIVTGSSRGIGRAIAEAYADAGARVVISSRKQIDCDEVVTAINARHGEERAIAVPADLADRSSLKNLIAQTRRHWGQIDVLVCNAASSSSHHGPMGDITEEQFLRVLTNNVLANHWLISAATKEMIERKDGAVIVISSIGGLLGSKVIGAYNVTKAADFHLVRNFAVELGPHNVRINAIAPGLIQTEFARALWENRTYAAAMEQATPLGRIGQPEEIAGAALYLGSKASSFVTGQTIVVDGGTTISGVV